MLAPPAADGGAGRVVVLIGPCRSFAGPRCRGVNTFREAYERLLEEDGMYELLLTGDQARAMLRALAATGDDAHAAAAHERLLRQIERRHPRRPTEEEDRVAREQGLPPYDLPDADALQAFAAPGKRRRGPRPA